MMWRVPLQVEESLLRSAPGGISPWSRLPNPPAPRQRQAAGRRPEAVSSWTGRAWGDHPVRFAVRARRWRARGKFCCSVLSSRSPRSCKARGIALVEDGVQGCFAGEVGQAAGHAAGAVVQVGAEFRQGARLMACRRSGSSSIATGDCQAPRWSATLCRNGLKGPPAVLVSGGARCGSRGG